MLQAHNISYRIKQAEILHDISFNASPGELLAVLGANGAGKSTLLKLLTAEVPLQAGYIGIQQKSIANWSAKELAKFRAVLTQQSSLSLPFTVEEVVMMGRYPHFERQEQQLDHSIVLNALHKTGIEHLAKRDYLTLSGGEQQRTHLARVFAQIWFTEVHETRYLFMDEPINSLDVQHQHRTLQLANEFKDAGNVVVAVLHDVNLAAQYADKILLLKRGKVLAWGTVDEVLTAPLLSECYNYPVHVERHPHLDCPVVFFGGTTPDSGAKIRMIPMQGGKASPNISQTMK